MKRPWRGHRPHRFSRRVWTVGCGVGISAIVAALLFLGSAYAPTTATPSRSPLPSDTPRPQLSPTPTFPPTATASPAPIARPADVHPAAVTWNDGPPGAWIALSPDHGPPGTLIEIDGYLPGGPSTGRSPGSLCWQSCQTGLSELSTDVVWTSNPGHFVGHLRVPTVPWLEADGLHALVPGDYPVGVDCIGGGCATGGFETWATFRVTSPDSSACASGPCGWLTFDPPAAAPGTIVHFHGWAPLIQGTIDGSPMGYQLLLEDVPPLGVIVSSDVAQSTDGNVSGSFRVPTWIRSRQPLTSGNYTVALVAWFVTIGNAQMPENSTANPSVTVIPMGWEDSVEVAPSSFQIPVMPSWASLGTLRPLAIERSTDLRGDSVISAEGPAGSADSRSIAYCGRDGIHVSRDGGTTWKVIPTRNAVPALALTSHPIFDSPGMKPICWSVLLDPVHPTSYDAVFLVRDAVDPMVSPAFVGYVTTNAGKSWVLAPPTEPGGAFGGFAASKGMMQELYGDWLPEQDRTITTVRQSSDGGRTWTTGRLACPEIGPCVRWGAGPAVIPPQRAPYSAVQTVEVSADGGKSWGNLDWPSEVWLEDNFAELAPLGPHAILLIDGNDERESPLTLTRDGGQTWQAVTLPPLTNGKSVTYTFLDLQLLPTGALVARTGHDQPWQFLEPTATSWCQVSTQQLPASARSFTGANGRLWWLDPGDNGHPAGLRSVPLASVGCVARR